MNIRLEQPKDFREVENLTREAFWNVYRPGCTEHYVLNQYRTNPDFIPELDFVMEEGDKIIGHVMFSKASLISPTPRSAEGRLHGKNPSRGGEGSIYSQDGDAAKSLSTPLPPAGGAGGGAFGGESVPSWTFGPISIHPDYKRKGYGLKLLKYAIEKAKEMGIGFLCMEGNIEFYKHAGFDLASKLNIHYHAEPKDAEVPYFLAQELIPGWLQNNGIAEATYCPPKGYFVADENPEAFEAYEATFPQKEKAFQEGQLPQFCQSCGMPLTRIEDCGTNANGSTRSTSGRLLPTGRKNFDYCQYCYKDGQFLQECTMDEMIEHCAQFVDEVNKQMPKPMTKEEYKQMMQGFFPMLKRWRK